jgi:putative CocE/NonD family hydrolase
MTGQSYLGWSQLATAQNRPQALKCIAPELIFFDTYSESLRPGGIMLSRWLRMYGDLLGGLYLNRYERDGLYLPAAPVVDEDRDGQLCDELPLSERGDPAVFVDDGPPRFRDCQTRTNSDFFRATIEHCGNFRIERFMDEERRFADTRLAFAGESFDLYDTSPGGMLEAVVEQQLPVLNIGGWFDGFTKGTTKLYASLAGRTQTRLLIGPRFHPPRDTPEPYKEWLGYDGDFTAETLVERIAFWERHLKGVDSPIDDQPPVRIYVVHSGWRSEQSWPLERQEVTPFYLHEAGRLATQVPEEGVDTYQVDFSHSSSYGSNRVNRWILTETPDTVMVRTEPDRQCLIYETEPLPAAVEVTGHPLVHLRLSSNRSAGDVFVYLSDVDEMGEAVYVSEGQHRIGFSTRLDPRMQTRYRTAVRPELPWYGFRQQDYTEDLLANGRVVELDLDLIPIAWRFRKGHRIRIAVAGADSGNFELHPRLCSGDDPESCISTELYLHRGSAQPSRIDLPVIPG